MCVLQEKCASVGISCFGKKYGNTGCFVKLAKAPKGPTPFGLLERLVSVLRGKILCKIYHFISFVAVWTMCGMMVEASGLISHHGWWMCLGWIVGHAAWWIADKVKGFAETPAH